MISGKSNHLLGAAAEKSMPWVLSHDCSLLCGGQGQLHIVWKGRMGIYLLEGQTVYLLLDSPQLRSDFLKNCEYANIPA